MMTENFGINVLGFVNKQFGLGQAVRSNIEAIKVAKIPISINNFPLESSAENTLVDGINNENPYDFNLIHINFDKLYDVFKLKGSSYFEKKINIGYWVWETENFPEDGKVFFDFFDEIWVPSSFCAESISRKITVPVFKIPHPVSFNYTVYEEQKQGRFVFLTMFDYNSSIHRKNPIDVIEAFHLAFGKNNPKVLLKIKSSKSIGFKKEKELLLEKIEQDSSISLIEEILSEHELYQLICDCNCFVSLHKSEGFGLTMAEAMLLGKPVIATGYSANTDFMNLNNSFLVEYELEKIGKNYYYNTEEDFWAKPNIEKASEKMKYVFENREKASIIGKKAQKDIVQNLNYEKIGALIKERIMLLQPKIKSKFNPINSNGGIADFENKLLEEKLEKLRNLTSVKLKVKYKNLVNKITGKNRKYLWEK